MKKLYWTTSLERSGVIRKKFAVDEYELVKEVFSSEFLTNISRGL